MSENFAAVFECGNRVIARAPLSVSVQRLREVAKKFHDQHLSCSVDSSPKAVDPGLRVHTLSIDCDSHGSRTPAEIAQELRGISLET